MTAMRRAGLVPWIPALLVAATLAAFLPTLGNDFVRWDDAQNLLENPHYRGLGWAQLRWMATTSHVGHWVPLAWLTLGLDYVVWGMAPAGYHLTSLLIHAGTTLAVYALARALLARAVPVGAGALALGAAAAALVFGLHPLRVEAVAWATARRDVLSGLFGVLTLLAYVRAATAAGAGRRRLLVASVAAHAAGLLSKSSVITMPLALLVLDVYPLRRLPGAPGRWLAREPLGVLAEKTPYAALSAAQALLTYRAFRADLGELATPLSGPESVARVLVSLWTYPVRTLLPLGLSPLYEAPPGLRLLDAEVIVAAAGVALVTALAWLARRRCPGLGAAWAGYVVLLLPAAGVLSLGDHLTADRYSYLPGLGMALLGGGAVAAVAEAGARGRRRGLAGLAVGLVAALALALGTATWHQVRVWRDSASLWQHAVTVRPDCAPCQVYRGDTLLDAGAVEAALGHYERAIRLRPDGVLFYVRLGQTLERLGRRPEAMDWYRRGLEHRPGAVTVRFALAGALVGEGRLDEAVQTLDGAWRYHPPERLLRVFEGAVRRRPDAPLPRLGLARAWLAVGDRARARREHEVLRQLHPGLAAALAVPGS
jgi:hypothetical protein